MKNPLSNLCRPHISKLQEDKLYQTEREILGLEEHAYQYEIALRKAQVALSCARDRRQALKEDLGQEAARVLGCKS